MSTYDEHQNGDCWPSTCPICELEDNLADAASEPTYGHCTGCGAVETLLNQATGTKDLSHIGESDVYPTGYGCELCA